MEEEGRASRQEEQQVQEHEDIYLSVILGKLDFEL